MASHPTPFQQDDRYAACRNHWSCAGNSVKSGSYNPAPLLPCADSDLNDLWKRNGSLAPCILGIRHSSIQHHWASSIIWPWASLSLMPVQVCSGFLSLCGPCTAKPECIGQSQSPRRHRELGKVSVRSQAKILFDSLPATSCIVTCCKMASTGSTAWQRDAPRPYVRCLVHPQTTW